MDLTLIVRDYIRRFRPRAAAELESFRTQHRIEDVLDRAARCIDGDGKRFSHQFKITREAIENARARLLANAGRVASAKTFGVLIRTLEEILRPVAGVGELYIYDTALRVGAWLRIMPEQVLLHAGTRQGARNLKLGVRPNQRFLLRGELPPAFHVLEAHEVEDVLCIYKDIFLADEFEPPPERCYLPDDQDVS